jgi:hypothetical protein
MSIEFLRPNICTTMSGAPIYGTYWPPNTQAYGSSLDQSSYGAFGQQALTQAAAQQQAFLAQQQALAYAQFTGATGAQFTGCYTSPEPEPKAKSIEDAGISAGEIIGHRVWRITGGLLRSMAVDTVWAPNEVMEGKPGDHNGMGVHAFKTASLALTEYGALPEIVVGTVLLWGDVIEHELGYRAQFGKVNSIDFLLGEKSESWVWSWWAGWRRRQDEPSLELQRLRHRYGV